MSQTDHYRKTSNTTDTADAEATESPATAKEKAKEVADKVAARVTTAVDTAAAKEKAKEVADKVTARVATAVDETKKAVADPERRHAAQESVEQEVRRNPWGALAAAFLIGMRMGRMRSRRR